ncbi:MAG: hypothetical protein FWG40_01100 [Peptococcaceae bacterium]|nr:hypothetical protein [Peptococcaceae bacterium]
MRNGVMFGDKHSIDDWDLLMTKKSIPDADPRLEFLSVPAGDVVYDFTEDYGRVLYNQRCLVFEFDTFQDPSEWWNLRKEISAHINGRRLRIVLDQEPEHYFIGRCKVADFSNLTSVAMVKIEAIVDPYRYKHDETVLSLDVDGPANVVLRNEFKNVVPEITTSAPIAMTMNGLTKQVSAGSWCFADFMLREGHNIMTITGSAHVRIRYQEGIL